MTIDPAEVKAGQRENWDGASAGWAATQGAFERGAHTVTERLVQLAGIGDGSRVLDVATGHGEPALTAARLVGATGRVVGTDISPAMLDIARRRAREADVHNVEFVEADVEGLDAAGTGFDAVLSRFGLMFATDHVAAFRGIGDRLTGGGILACAVWAAQAKHLLSTGPLAITARLDLPQPPPGAPEPFSMSDPDQLRVELTKAGFVDVTIDEHVAPFVFPDVASYVEFNKTALPPGMMRTTRERLGEDEIDALLADAVAHLVAPDGTLPLPSTALLVRAVTPERSTT